MKKSKNLKTTLSAISIIAIFVTMIMAIMAALVRTPDGYNFLYTIYDYTKGTASVPDTWKICLDWDYAGIFLAFLAIGLITSLMKFGMFTIPAVRSKSANATMTLICDIIALAALIFLIVGTFIPEGVEMMSLEGGVADAVKDSGYDRLIVTAVAAWAGAPLAFIASLGTIGLNRSTKK